MTSLAVSDDAESATGAAGPALSASDFAAVAAILQSEARIHLTQAKRTLVHARLGRRLRDHQLSSFRDYVRLVQNDAAERAAMVVALTTNHTHFFREGHHFDHFRQNVLPWLQGRARTQPVRIWSAGCSSGEEAYTIAMCLLGQDRSKAGWLRNSDVRLLATDISPPMVEAARRGIYSASTVEPIPAHYRAAWMRSTGAEFEVIDDARSLVTARVLNLFDPWPMRHQYDVIFCRNVMIYFDDAAKAELEARFADILAPGGYLYIGHSERLIGDAADQMTSCGQTIYVKKDAGA